MKFHLKNVGKISSAAFDIKPLTIFIGKNGSGKTCAASALWVALSYIKKTAWDEKLIDIFHKTEVEQLLTFLAKDMVGKKEMRFSINVNQLSYIQAAALSHLKDITPGLLEETFNCSLFQQAELGLSYEHHDSVEIQLSFTFDGVESDENVGLGKLSFHFADTQVTRPFPLPEPSLLKNKERVNAIVASWKKALFRDLVHIALMGDNVSLLQKTYYLPAARTGLMLSVHDIVQSDYRYNNGLWLSDKSQDIPKRADLTLPIKSFIAEMDSLRQPYIAMGKYSSALLKELMGGSVSINPDSRHFEFRPDSVDSSIPLASASSLVTELASLSVLIPRILNKSSFVIFEEPEAHLHLSAQREIAKKIVMLVNRGCRVLLTSHSDTFLQQLNNLLLLNQLEDKELCSELGIDLKTETISRDRVALYDFDMQGNLTTVKPIDCGKYGFVAQSINDELQQLSRETYNIQDRVDEQESFK